MNSGALCDFGKLLGRVLMSLIFISAGWSKIAGYAGTQAYMESAGVPGALLPLVIIAELGGGLAILFGFLTRWAALGLAIFCLASAWLFHYVPGDQAQMISFMKNITIAGGFFILACAGGGNLSVDHWLRRNK
ncbi:Inner membrane protein YqjF [Microbulbifer aggregans]|uniref:Inner membrane protein YqjF n=1 Tax=Microbulbifer aggregans TaxID=1769779 RepID=A0A1C9W5C7_9GAMM|nr:DoxX family protein [Microbulbifer aggregans]AOS96337.1 Inner membrane protein YqjF [Microbulbifer aggregans]